MGAPEPTLRPTPELPKKPDYGLFVGMVGVLLALLLPILQMNGTELNWQWSAVAYSAIAVGFVWTYLTHFAPHHGQKMRFIGGILVLLIICGVGGFGTHLQYQKQHSPPPPDPKFESLSNELHQVIGELADFRHAMMSNNS